MFLHWRWVDRDWHGGSSGIFCSPDRYPFLPGISRRFKPNSARRVSGGFLEITDRFWPYERAAPPLAANDAWYYTAKVKELMQARTCVRSSFSAPDYKLAQEFYQRQIPLQTVERAIHLGCLRKYAALLNHPGGPLITSLHYFALLLEEVQRLLVAWPMA